MSNFSCIAQVFPHDDFCYRVGFYDDRRLGRHFFNAFICVARATVDLSEKDNPIRNLQEEHNLCTYFQFRQEMGSWPHTCQRHIHGCGEENI